MSLAVYGLPLVVTTSGGKDSSVCVALAERAGIPFEVLHNRTTADAPETVYFIREEFRRLEAKGIKCTIEYPTYKGKRMSMWGLIPQAKNPPNRFRRYCCSILKEHGGAGRFIATGVRWAESVKRKSSRGIYEALTSDLSKKIILNNDNDDRRRLFETCTSKAKRVCNPIVDWTDADVWDYIRSEHLTLNPLCQCGFYRVGCIGCPMASKHRSFEFVRYPKYKALYIRAFNKMLELKLERGEINTKYQPWETGLDVFHWWMEDGVLPGQLNFDDIAGFMEDDGEGMEPDTRRGVTLAAVLSLLRPYDHVFIERNISPHELEAVGSRTVKDGRYMPVEPEPVFIVEGDGSGRYVTDEGEVIAGRRALLSEQSILCKVAFVPHWKSCPEARHFRHGVRESKAKRGAERKAKGQMSVF